MVHQEKVAICYVCYFVFFVILSVVRQSYMESAPLGSKQLIIVFVPES
jgi:hypothetical protein